MKGAGLKVGQIKDFLNASYAENPPNQLGEYQLDIELTNLYVKVYFSISNTQNKAKKKYKGYKFETLGHSQGGL